ncbi:sterol desaturase family protein [Gayadomonas joobiniege]|uniref:sterol desaturase family protein n=1 Tax=Gayadomonas joobiniege TaxID=1234606 RepID=UPI000361253A|nr:sterol desaturase family protein [Gayadomonas joobiniege]
MFELIFNWLQADILQISAQLLEASNRLFWAYLLAAGLAALIISGSISYLFHRRIWWHASARCDYWLFIINRFIRFAVIAPLLFSSVPIAIFIYDVIKGFNGPAQMGGYASHSALGFTLIFFILDDLSRFLLHFCLHKMPLLWCFHKVHHSATVLTPMTIFRSHPIETLLYASRMTLVQGIALGLSMALWGTNISLIDIMGVNAFIFAFNLAASNLRHSHVWLRWPTWLQYIVICPAQHQLHHQRNRTPQPVNLGTCLAVWDWLSGTLSIAAKNKPGRFAFGLNHKENKQALKLSALYFEPFKTSGKLVYKRFQHCLNCVKFKA